MVFGVMVFERLYPTQSAQASRSRSCLPKTSSMLVVAGLLLIAASRFRRVEVSGYSMTPAFEPGDRLLVAPPIRVRPGQVVALTDPRRSDRLLVKRVMSIRSGQVEVSGDNDLASTDSRHFGPVPRSSLVGAVVYRYGPSGRIGRIGRLRA